MFGNYDPIDLRLSATIVALHKSGLDRIVRVIDGNPNFDDLMKPKLIASEKMLFPSSLDLISARKVAREYATESLQRFRIKPINARFEGFVCHGRTANNLREFEFFDKLCMPIGLRICDKNYAFEQPAQTSVRRKHYARTVKALSKQIDAFYARRQKISSALVHQQLLYSRSFVSFLWAFTRRKSVIPTALVQANDHSPTQVALSMVMKGLQVPRIYLQHAEVSKIFPELDFDISVLRNSRSKRIYEEIAPIRGDVFIIGRENVKNRKKAKISEPKKVCVVVYTTSGIFPDKLKELLNKLQENVRISEIAVKPHPGNPDITKEVCKLCNIRILEASPKFDHIAIVGNSSVALELVAAGIPVYQNFDFDPIEADYYGFLHDRITNYVGIAQLTMAFWELRAHPNWTAEALSDRVPNATSNSSETKALMTRLRTLKYKQVPGRFNRTLYKRVLASLKRRLD